MAAHIGIYSICFTHFISRAFSVGVITFASHFSLFGRHSKRSWVQFPERPELFFAIYSHEFFIHYAHEFFPLHESHFLFLLLLLLFSGQTQHDDTWLMA